MRSDDGRAESVLVINTGIAVTEKKRIEASAYSDPSGWKAWDFLPAESRTIHNNMLCPHHHLFGFTEVFDEPG